MDKIERIVLDKGWIVRIAIDEEIQKSIEDDLPSINERDGKLILGYIEIKESKKNLKKGKGINLLKVKICKEDILGVDEIVKKIPMFVLMDEITRRMGIHSKGE